MSEPPRNCIQREAVQNGSIFTNTIPILGRNLDGRHNSSAFPCLGTNNCGGLLHTDQRIIYPMVKKFRPFWADFSPTLEKVFLIRTQPDGFWRWNARLSP